MGKNHDKSNVITAAVERTDNFFDKRFVMPQ